MENNFYQRNKIPEQQMPDIDELIYDQKKYIIDDSLLTLHQKLAQTRQLRKASENGVKILNGRVRCLKDENKRTLAKINMTNKKTNNKLINLERRKTHSKEKMEHNKKLENDLYKLKEKNYIQKVERDTGIINSKKKLINENQMKGKISKKEKKDCDNIKIMNEQNEQNIKKNKIEVIRSKTLQKTQKKKMMELDKKEGIIKDLEEKINYEINKKEDLEIEINKMLQEESEILERINQTNEIQKKIFEDFEKMLSSGGINDFIYNNKFIINNNDYEKEEYDNFEEKNQE